MVAHPYRAHRGSSRQRSTWFFCWPDCCVPALRKRHSDKPPSQDSDSASAGDELHRTRTAARGAAGGDPCTHRSIQAQNTANGILLSAL
jgi:hypothetical protein